MREELLKMLKRDCYRKGNFKLSSGKYSEHYVNCKPVTLNGKGLLLLSISILENVDRDFVAMLCFCFMFWLFLVVFSCFWLFLVVFGCFYVFLDLVGGGFSE